MSNKYGNIRSGHGAGDVGGIIPFRNMEHDRIRCYVQLALWDVAAIVVSFLFATQIYTGDSVTAHGIRLISVLVPIYLGTAMLNASYGEQVLSDPWTSAFKASRAFMLAAATTLIIVYSFKAGSAFSRFVFWAGTFGSLLLLFGGRLLLGWWLVNRSGGVPYSMVVLTHGVEWHGSARDRVLDVAQIGFDPATDDPLHYDYLAKLVGNCDRVLVACRDDQIAAWAHVLKCMAVNGEIVAPDVDRIGMIGVGQHDGQRTLVVSAGPLHLRERIVKRTFDIVVSSAALLFLAPFLIVVAIAIRIESPGPILFRQQRIGRDNVLFMMFKFRSMYHDKCDASASVLTSRSDSRVTRVGQFLRKNSIDELPQLLNVLRGDMSIVGPRPHALSAKAAERLYWEIDDRYRHRHAVKPGVTGLAQIRGFRGATVLASDLTNRLASDLEYLRGWSMRKDLWIMVRTVFVIRHDNAF